MHACKESTCIANKKTISRLLEKYSHDQSIVRRHMQLKTQRKEEARVEAAQQKDEAANRQREREAEKVRKEAGKLEKAAQACARESFWQS